MVSISVVVPTYNASAFLLDTLQSIQNQSYADFECIVVDDCSMDNTFAIAEDFAKKDCRFIALQNDVNRGTGFTRNAGLQHAKGNCIAFLDADDIWVRDKLWIQYQYMCDNPDVAITYGVYGNMDAQGNKTHIVVIPPSSLSIYQYMANTTIGLSTSMINTQLTGSFRFGLRRTRQDCELWIQLLSKGHKAHRFSNQISTYYRKHPQQISGNKFKMPINTLKLYITQSYVNKAIALLCFVGYVFNAVRKRV